MRPKVSPGATASDAVKHVWRSRVAGLFLLSNTAVLATSHDTVSERLRRWTRNPLGSARRGSNPLAVAFVPSKGFFFIVLALALHAFFSFLCVIFLTPCLSPSRSNSPFILPSLSTLCFSTSSLFLFHISPLSHSLCVLLYAGAGKPCVPHRNCSCGLMDKAPPS